MTPGAAGAWSVLVALWEGFPWLLGLGLESAAGLSLGWACVVASVVVLIDVALAIALQRGLVKRLRTRADRRDDSPMSALELLELELACSLLAPVIMPGVWALRAVERARARFSSSVASETPERDGPPGAGPGASLLAVTLGPTYLFSAVALVGVVAIAWALEPLLRAQLGMASGQPVYDTLALGWIPPAAFYLPLSEHAPLALILSVISFSVGWTWISRAWRLALRSSIARNVFSERHQPAFLRSWRRTAGAAALHETDASFRTWAPWLGLAAALLVIVGFFFGRQPPYQLPPVLVALAWISVVAWATHLLLRGELVIGEPHEARTDGSPKARPGWPDVLHALGRVAGGLRPFRHVRRPRSVASLELAHSPSALLAPALAELVPPVSERETRGEAGKLTVMQQAVLERVAQIGRADWVDTSSGGPLSLGSTRLTTADEGHPGVIVVAPEGAGRSTLALLACFDHVLSCARTALLVAPTRESARVLYDRASAMLDPSTHRWNVRVRLMGLDVASDLEQGIVPDVVITDLSSFVLDVLERDDLLAAVGLLVIDDIDEVVGARECHAQLAFRRLFVRLRAMRTASVSDQELALKVLVLGGDAMHEVDSWARSIVAGVRYGAAMHFASRVKVADELPPPVTFSADAPDPPREKLAGAAPGGPVHVFHDLSTLRPVRESDADPKSTRSAERRARLRVSDIVDACERVGVPWHFRAAVDGRRGEGRRALNLSSEPLHWEEDPQDAVVVLVEGPTSAVERELDRLAHAGARAVATLTIPIIALIRVVDPDEARVFESIPETDDATRRIFASFPRPAITRPVGVVRDRHVTAELLSRGLEVGEIMEIFGAGPLMKLRTLAHADAVAVEPHRDVAGGALTDRVRLRLQARAVTDTGTGDGAVGGELFPRPPADIDEASSGTVVVEDTTSTALRWRSDAGTAHRRYYPRRIFENAYGWFEVIGGVRRDDSGLAPPILVAPRLASGTSTPRRRSCVRRRGPPAGSLAGSDLFARQRVVIGQGAIDVELCAVECESEHVATLQTTPDGRAVLSRMIFEASSPERYRGRYRSAAFVLYPEPEHRTAGPTLDRDGARLLASVLRVVVQSAYRHASESLDVLLQLDDVASAPDSSATLGPDDALVVVDAHDGGNGATRAVARDGAEALLRAALAYVRPFPADDDEGAVEDERWRWLLLHDESAPERDEDLGLLETEGVSAARTRWDTHSTRVGEWLTARVGDGAADDGVRLSLGPERARGPRPEDLGYAAPADCDAEQLIWRRHRWLFPTAPEAQARAYVIDLAVSEHLLSEPAPRMHVTSPPTKQVSQTREASSPERRSEAVPRRVTERIEDAVQAMALARGSLEALAVPIGRLLTRLRRDDDDSVRERERALNLIDAIAKGLPAYAGPPRPRRSALVLSLVTGTTDDWARALLTAELRRLLLGEATLHFDGQGRPLNIDPASSAPSSVDGLWEIRLSGGAS